MLIDNNDQNTVSRKTDVKWIGMGKIETLSEKILTKFSSVSTSSRLEKEFFLLFERDGGIQLQTVLYWGRAEELPWVSGLLPAARDQYYKNDFAITQLL